MVRQHLSQLGFSDRETSVFLSLVETGKANASKLSRRTGIRRTTVYSVLSTLIQKGVVSQQQEKEGSIYLVNKPAALMRVIQRERDELEQREVLTKELIENLSGLFQQSEQAIPKIHFFEGKKNVENMLYDSYEARQQSAAKQDAVIWGYQDSSYFEEYKKYSEHNFSSRKKDGNISAVRLFADQAHLETEITELYKLTDREIRQFPKGIELTSTLWIHGDFITMIQSRHAPHYAIQIKDSWIASNLKKMFQFVWFLTTPGMKAEKAPEKGDGEE